jgi:hypothetical protein
MMRTVSGRLARPGKKEKKQMTKKIALTIALALATTGLTFAAGQQKPATSTTQAKKHHKKGTKKAATKTPEKK